MRVIYLRMTKDRVSILSYAGDLTKKPKYKPNYHVATTTGIHLSKECTNHNYVEIETISFISFKSDIPTLMDALQKLIEDNTLFVFMDKDSAFFIKYLKVGDTETGLKDASFQDNLDEIRSIRKTLNEVTIKQLFFKEISPEHFVTLSFRLLANTDSDITYTGKDYFRISKFKHPFISGKYIVIDPRTFYHGDRYRISCVNYPEPKEICRPLPDISESIVDIKSLPQYWITVIEKMIEMMDTEKRVFIIPIDTIMDTFNIHSIVDYGFKVTSEVSLYQYTVKTLAGVSVAYTTYPPALSMIIRDNHRYYLDDDFDAIDIMDHFYIDGSIDPNLQMSGQLFKVHTEAGTIVLHVGFDTLSRNVMKRIEKHVKKVQLRYREENRILRYYTYTELDDGDSVITYSPFNGYTIKNLKL